MKQESSPELIVLSARQERSLYWLDRASALLDNRFRIPGTQIRFGLDFLIGLIPYVGDVIGLALSGFLLLIMASSGASGMVVLKMTGNILLDSVVGVFPIIGDIFDLRYKANRRNVSLLREHYREGKHRGSALWVILLVLFALAGAFFLMIFIVWKVFQWLWETLSVNF